MNQFENLGISQEIVKAIDDLGFETPTPIQESAIPFLLEGRDVMGQAQTGTGKTAAFGIPLVQRADTSSNHVQKLVLCPTRELAVQVTEELITLATHVNGLKVIPVYGGAPIGRQIKQLNSGVQIVVGTPGRMIDHIKRSTLKLKSVDTIVLDEADEMLNMGFRDDIEFVLNQIEGDIQTVMFSATMSKEIKAIMNKKMHNPEVIRIKGKAITAPKIDQFVVEVRDSVRPEAIARFMDVEQFKLGLIFTNTKRQADQLALKMKALGFGCDCLHGDMRQAVRDKVMRKFRNGEIDLLVATDVAARGIDVDDVDVVFNFDIPQDPEYYVHRIGRTGRAGREGTAITFTSGKKNKKLKFIQRQVGGELKNRNLPTQEDVKDSRLQQMRANIEKELEKGGLREYIEHIEAMADDRFTPIEIAAVLLKQKMTKAEALTKPMKKGKKVHANSGAMKTIRINVGYKSKIGPGDIVGAIAGETGISGGLIGNIDIQNKHTMVDVPADQAQKIVSIMNTKQIKGFNISVDYA